MALRTVTDLFPRTYGPTIDGYVFPDQPIARIRAGRSARVPVIIGNNLEETASWLDSVGTVADEPSYREALDRIFRPEARDRILARYPVAQFASPRDALMRVTTDALFTCTTRRVARVLGTTGTRVPVFRYLFTHRLETKPGPGYVGHSVEMPFVFQSWSEYSPTTNDRTLSDKIMELWTRMAATGRPEGAGVSWSPVTPADTRYLQLDDDRMLMGDQADASCDFWDSTPLPSPHL
jgi:carboxylesterase type B